MSGDNKYEKKVFRKEHQIDENEASAMVSAMVLPQTWKKSSRHYGNYHKISKGVIMRF